MIGNGFKFIWSGGCKVENGVGVIVANWLVGKIVGVERFNDRVKVNIVIWDVVWEGVPCYYPQAGRSVNEKEEFYELMDKVVTSEKVLVGGDFNGHVGSDMGGFGGVYVKRVANIWLWIRTLERRWRRLIRVVMVVSCLELPNKGWGEERCCWG